MRGTMVSKNLAKCKTRKNKIAKCTTHLSVTPNINAPLGLLDASSVNLESLEESNIDETVTNFGKIPNGQDGRFEVTLQDKFFFKLIGFQNDVPFGFHSFFGGFLFLSKNSGNIMRLGNGTRSNQEGLDFDSEG